VEIIDLANPRCSRWGNRGCWAGLCPGWISRVADEVKAQQPVGGNSGVELGLFPMRFMCSGHTKYS
jgi:hypothetical protein